ncbi:MAG: hypothetical protein KDF65_14955, partial [Anaerolineae bacterium]|nr:hypothetical protein [Anaerolineae bacterium]
MTLSGARHKYANEQAGEYGKTAFDTQKWTLGVRGRAGRPAGRTAFELDGRMVAADQPPFYPYMKSALIRVQSIDHIMQKPQGFVKAYYYDGFVDEGFDGGNKQAEIFLTLSPSSLVLDASSNSEKVGGFASPSGLPAGLSRKIGVVNGLDLGEGTERSSDRFPDAAQGIFKPKEFFSAPKQVRALKSESGLELFNVDIIRLVKDGDLTKMAPKLNQICQIDLHLESGEKEFLGALVEKTIEALYGQKGVFAAIKDLISKEELEKLYGSLYQALEPFIRDPNASYPSGDNEKPNVEQLLKTIHEYLTKEEKERNPEITEALVERAFASIIEHVRLLIKEIGRFLQEPVPDAVKQIMETFELFFSGTFKEWAQQQALEFLADLPDAEALSQWAREFSCLVIDAQLGEVLLDSSRTCEDYAKNPKLLFDDLAKGVSAPIISYVDDGIASYMKQLRTAIGGELFGTRDQFKSAVLGYTVQATDILSTLLVPCAQEPDNIMCPDVQNAFAEALTSVIFDRKGASLKKSLSLFEIEAELRKIQVIPAKIQDEISTVLSEYREKIRLKDTLNPPVTKEEIIDRLKSLLLSGANAYLDKGLATVEAILERWPDNWKAFVSMQSTALIDRVNTLLSFVDAAVLPDLPADWCQLAAGYVKLLMDKVMPDTGTLKTQAQTVIDKLAELANNAKLPAQARDSLERLSRNAATLHDHLDAMERSRNDLSKLSDDVCGELSGKYAKLATRVARERQELYHLLIDIVRAVKEVKDSAQKHPANDGTTITSSIFEGLTESVQTLLVDLSALSAQGTNNIQKLKEAVDKFSELKLPPTIKHSVEKVAHYVENNAQDLLDGLNKVQGDLDELAALLNQFEDYQEAVEQMYFGLLTSSYGFTKENLQSKLVKTVARGLPQFAAFLHDQPYHYLKLVFDPIKAVVDSHWGVFEIVFGDEFVEAVRQSFSK